MRILWLSPTSGTYIHPSRPHNYNGGGWVESLQRMVSGCSEIELALSFPSDDKTGKDIHDGVAYYSIKKPKKSAVRKLCYYYGGYKHDRQQQFLSEIIDVINDFRPDAIHLFGIESPLAAILGHTGIPIVVHLQGLLAPCDNAFFPVGFNKRSFDWPPAIREWLLRNGFRYAKNSIHVRGKQELQRFKKVIYCMGRTEWDKQVSRLLAPDSTYFHVDEVLRQPFYDYAGKWEPKKGKVIITSTISETVYKGLDLVLKTASLLKNETHLDFKWQVIGLEELSCMIRFFERELGIYSKSVNVEYKGVLNADELAATLLESHMYVHPSYIDNSPNSLCEAQILGVPVIATYVGGIPSLITHDETGFLVPANAPFELAYHIKRLSTSPSLARQVSTTGTNVAQSRHNKENIIRELLNAYKSIVPNP